MITVEVEILTIAVEATIVGIAAVTCLPGTVENSSGSFSEEIVSGETLVLDDYDIEVYLNNVLYDTATAPAMEDIEINITN